MKREYDFSQGKRGPVLRTPQGKTRVKTRVTIRLDEDVLAWFRKRVEDAGGGSYQTLINDALRAAIEQKREPLEATLRRVIREELRKAR
ncbi:MAG: BrnA antitoxin family protein [Bryobacterales bacterium]|nr:BrnA antitoxin family protein [Bryobacterales bacterium]